MFYTTDFDRHIDSIFGGIHEPLWKTAKTVSDQITEYHYSDGELQMALPGFSKKDLEIEIEGSMLRISSEVSDDHETLFKKSFKKSFKIPSDVNGESATASMKDGVLTISFSKKVESKKIKVV